MQIKQEYSFFIPEYIITFLHSQEKNMHKVSHQICCTSCVEVLTQPYKNGLRHLQVSCTPEHSVFKEARKFSHGVHYPPMPLHHRISHFIAGVMLCIPLINMVTELALCILFSDAPRPCKKPSAWKRVNHIVVLMLENRSFDNMLGKLYPKSERFNGLSGNEVNSYVDSKGLKHTIKVWSSRDLHQGPRMDTPNPDPGEEFADMTHQLFEKNVGVSSSETPSMGGFAQNYYNFICRDKTAQGELRKKRGVEEESVPLLPTEEETADIMHYYAPEQVPVITQLARNFAVSDRYHASAPNQTWPNRFFVHSATAGGYENNTPPHFPYSMKTIFTRINDAGRDDWAIYYDDVPQSATLSDLWPHPDHFKRFDRFLKDAADGRLPSYSFIEPRFYREDKFPNDLHPPHDVRHGEALIAEVYNALRKSPQWKETLFVITCDEHGGCYDHQPPPQAVPPESPRERQKFHFDRYGVRVPAVFVSPLIAPGTILRPPEGATAPVFDHTSIIASVRHCFDLGGPLTRRDAAAPDFSSVLNMPEGQYNMGPEEIIAPAAPKTTIEEAEGLLMNGLQKVLHKMASCLPDHSSTAPDGEERLLNSVKKMNALAAQAVQGTRARNLSPDFDADTSDNLLAGAKAASANFAKFVGAKAA